MHIYNLKSINFLCTIHKNGSFRAKIVFFCHAQNTFSLDNNYLHLLYTIHKHWQFSSFFVIFFLVNFMILPRYSDVIKESAHCIVSYLNSYQ